MRRKKTLFLLLFYIIFFIQSVQAESFCDESVYNPRCEKLVSDYGELLSKGTCDKYPEADKITILWENNLSEYELNPGYYREVEHKIVRVCNPNKEDVCVFPLRISAYYEILDVDAFNNFYIYHNGRAVRLTEGKNYRNYKVYFPSCAKGDVMEYQYRRYYEFPSVNAKGTDLWSVRDYYFQDEDPIIRRSLVVEFPMLTSTTYSHPGVGAPEKKLTNKYTYTWIKNDIEAYQYEAYAPPKREIIPRVSFSSVSSWNDVDKWSSRLIKESNPFMLDKYSIDFTLTFNYLNPWIDLIQYYKLYCYGLLITRLIYIMRAWGVHDRGFKSPRVHFSVFKYSIMDCIQKNQAYHKSYLFSYNQLVIGIMPA